jgi:RNA polymerase sigma-70 factor (ECF subfamily)
MMHNDTKIMGPDHEFDTTSWTLIRAVGDVNAFDTFVRIYWKPLYFFVRSTATTTRRRRISSGLSDDDPGEGVPDEGDPARGRFRTFLLAALTNFMKDRVKAAVPPEARRRPFDPVARLRHRRARVRHGGLLRRKPETVLNRTWAARSGRQAISELKGDPAHLEAFTMYLADADYDVIAKKTGLTPAAAKMAVHRLKGQLRDTIQHYILQTSVDEDELKSEIAEFMALLS